MRELRSDEVRLVSGGELSIAPFEATIGLKLQNIIGAPILLGAIGAYVFGIPGAMVLTPAGFLIGLYISNKFVLGNTYYLICDENYNCRTFDSKNQPI
tara:strand:+ start:7356 stop:7649 length:294 start_codon:yes stop_codon:yes gene_type:complete